MKRIPLILSLALLLLLPAIALYPMLHASAEKDGVDSSTAIQEAAPSEAAPSEAAPSDSAVAAPAAPVAGSGSIDGKKAHSVSPRCRICLREGDENVGVSA